jgi:hypothetical protein
MRQANPAKQHQHWFLVAGEVVFTGSEPDVPPFMAHVNTVVSSRDGRLPMIAIGRCQQQIQMQFFKEVGSPDYKVTKVVILNIMPLGVFTNEEFNARPNQMMLKEMVQEPSLVKEIPLGNA